MSGLKVVNFKMVFPEYALTVDSFSVLPGEFLKVQAPSGFGKTTFLRGLMGLAPLSSGEIHLGDKSIEQMPVHLRNFGVVFQDHLLFPSLSAIENTVFGIKMRRKLEWRDQEAALEAFESLGLGHRAKAPIHELSGGERQRVALIRAILFNPELLILDEPLKGLDAEGIDRSMKFLREFLSRNPVPVIWVSHQGEDPVQGASIIGTGNRHFSYHPSSTQKN